MERAGAVRVMPPCPAVTQPRATEYSDTFPALTPTDLPPLHIRPCSVLAGPRDFWVFSVPLIKRIFGMTLAARLENLSTIHLNPTAERNFLFMCLQLVKPLFASAVFLQIYLRFR